MVHKDHGVAVRDQILHDTGQPCDIGWMQADGRLIQHVQDAGCPVADSAGELHSLPFAGGECGGCPVQGQIAQPQVEETLRRGLE